ncbi:RagB/SusD family nutrient uptake outer membrane protein [Hymenobacter cavernae]|uniref:Membrane protein n=1 Tax=Hymenobacter cavernae TaxID=2044852 RepID=A0ABQ1U2X7_9BACT|nr:RagB/SusD family nutrient uptake outer membrane protein [Hymenobacter cavernae]GGF09509.1 membrane protein [Hymenobacter cavernae]
MKTAKFLSALALTVSLGACKDEYFDRTPLDQPAESTFYTDETSVRQVLNDAYFTLRASYEFRFAFGDLASDDVYNSKFNNSANHITINESNVVADNGLVNDMWNRSYATISRCNLVLDNIGNIPMNDDTKLRYINEAKFLRALMYFNLVRIYGDVPLVLKDIKTSQEAYEYGRTPVAQVYEQIIADLKDAEQLPATYAQNADIGRATRGAAKGLLAKVYLTLKRYSDASPKLLEVINSGTYRLLDNYADVFDAARPNNAEVIFAVQYARGFDPVQGNPFVQGAFANEDIGTGVLRRGTGTFLITDELYNLFATNDTRKATITRLTGSRRAYNFTTKYFDKGMTSTVDSGNDWIELRYADVLLMYAEVQNELGNTAVAFTYLQQVRTRAGLTTPETLRGNQGAMRLAIEQERRLELYNEGHRWFDLLRTGRLLTVMNAHFASNLSNDEIGSGNSVQPYEQLFPVPRYQVNLNPNKITQNPGY